MQSLFRHTICLALSVCFLFQQTQAQNLVANPSFEDVNTCAEFAQPCSPSAWFFLSLKFTTGYYPRFRSATGSRHLRIIAASRVSVNRQYWETLLLCPLQAGEHYSVSLKIASPGTPPELAGTRPNLRDIGLWFTTKFIFVHGDSILQPRSFLSLTDATVKDLKNGWFELKKEFVPTSAAAVMIIGNFARPTNADIIAQRNPTDSTIDVLVDDIAVTRINGPACANAQHIKDSLYANIWRHSDTHPAGWHPDPPDSLPKNDQNDSLPPPARYGPTDDPLFGAPPHRTIDSPTPSHPNPILKTDTIIIRNIHFDFDKYFIQNPDTLQRYRNLFTRTGIKKIQAVGFTDDAGSETYNLNLSQKRAAEVAHLLSKNFNINPALIESEGRGISRKFPTKYLNRRVEIYILHE